MSAVDLLDEHETLARSLEAIRSAELQGRSADGLWDWFDRTLRAHIALEEEHLLPLYDLLPNHAVNASPRVLRRDHRLLLEHLDALARGDGDLVDRADRLAKLAGVLEHHDLREAQHFKPRLDAEADADTLAAALAGWKATEPPPADGAVRDRPLDPPSGSPLNRCRQALAMGDHQMAADWLGQFEPQVRKASSLALAAEAALTAGDLPGCWDKLRLLQIVEEAGQRPGGATK